jgi:hypothetical protein
MTMDVEQLRKRAGEAASKADKNTKPQIIELMSRVEERENMRLAWVGKLEAAQQEAGRAQGEVKDAENHLQRVTNELLALIGE